MRINKLLPGEAKREFLEQEFLFFLITCKAKAIIASLVSNISDQFCPPSSWNDK
jgi:hypothetical protein